MAVTLKGIIVCLVLLSFTPQGVHGFEIFHHEILTAVVGQDVSLPCTPKENTLKILQIEWKKRGEAEDQHLVVYNPQFGETIGSPNVALRSEKEGDMRTTLVLKALKETDSGRYICDLTTYPNGSIRKVTRLKVKDLDDIIKCDTNGTVEAESGQNVTVHCTADGFPNILFHWSKDNKCISDESSLVLWSVSKHDAGLYMLTVSVGNNTALVKRRGFNIKVPLTTTQSDEGPATTENPTDTPPLNVTLSTQLFSTSTKITGPTDTSANKTDESTEPGRGTNLTVTPDPPITTIQEVNSSVTLSTPVQPMNFTTDFSSNTKKQTKGIEVNSSTHNPIRVTSTAQSGTTYPPLAVSGTTYLPVVQSNVSTPWSHQPDGGNQSEAETSSQGYSVSTTVFPEKSTLAGEETHRTDTSSTLSQGSGVIIETEKGSQRYTTMLWIFPFLAVLILVGILYRRHVIQKRMDLPPPFKPPPPPVKYSSLKSQDIPMTDILI
ncbi:T-cell surface protein tactile [Esox lucius]|uniref:Ig-like domain-containing protein n=1 Tax=Esox lucius TaxID=8010 RepID=A0AAY5LB43_ESOLU|nr:T-cell surface protein tactile [Esox lucius]